MSMPLSSNAVGDVVGQSRLPSFHQLLSGTQAPYAPLSTSAPSPSRLPNAPDNTIRPVQPMISSNTNHWHVPSSREDSPDSSVPLMARLQSLQANQARHMLSASAPSSVMTPGVGHRAYQPTSTPHGHRRVASMGHEWISWQMPANEPVENCTASVASGHASTGLLAQSKRKRELTHITVTTSAPTMEAVAAIPSSHPGQSHVMDQERKKRRSYQREELMAMTQMQPIAPNPATALPAAMNTPVMHIPAYRSSAPIHVPNTVHHMNFAAPITPPSPPALNDKPNTYWAPTETPATRASITIPANIGSTGAEPSTSVFVATPPMSTRQLASQHRRQRSASRASRHSRNLSATSYMAQLTLDDDLPLSESSTRTRALSAASMQTRPDHLRSTTTSAAPVVSMAAPVTPPAPIPTSAMNVPVSSTNACGVRTESMEASPVAEQKRDANTTTETAASDHHASQTEPSSPTNGTRVSCPDCGKLYKHPGCLSKHRWEHHEHWPSVSRLLLTKHQQVQLMEAAQILVDIASLASSANTTASDSTGMYSVGNNATAQAL
jgi:hypothetical protein